MLNIVTGTNASHSLPTLHSERSTRGEIDTRDDQSE
jgi:hypothetical protein